jgi:hypothetical protein
VGLGFESFGSLWVCLGFFLWANLVILVHTFEILRLEMSYAFF